MTFDPAKPVKTRLINEPGRTTLWGNVYNGSNGIPDVIRLHRSRALCDDVSAADRAGLISMTFDSGRLVSFENHDVTGGGK